MNTGLSRTLLRLLIASALIVSLAALLRPAASESEPVVVSYQPTSADKSGGCSSEHWPFFSQNCLQAADATQVRTVTSTTLIDPGPIDLEVIVLPSTASHRALDTLAHMDSDSPNRASKPKKAPRTRSIQGQATERIATSPMLYGQ